MKRTKLLIAGSILSTSIASANANSLAGTQNNDNLDRTKLEEILVRSGIYEEENAIFFVDNLSEDDAKKLYLILEQDQISMKDEKVSFVF